MNNNQKKQILRDPVAAFISHYPDSPVSDHARLAEYTARYRSASKELKSLQNESRTLSRQIGAAKKAGNPQDDLKMKMQDQGRLIEPARVEAEKFEKSILKFFGSEDKPEAIHNKAQEHPSVPARTFSLQTIDSSSISIESLNDQQDEWDDYVNNNLECSVYHKARWRKLIESTFGHECFYFFARDGEDRVAGVLPLVRLKSRLFGDFLVSMPYFNYGGAVADHPAIEEKLMETANNEAAKLGVKHIEYRDNFSRQGLPVRAEKVNMALALPADETTLWQQFSPKLRAQIKRPLRENPQVSTGGKDILSDFYHVFARNMRDLGTPVYPKLFFGNILDSFQDACKVIVIKINNKPVAAAFLIGNQGRLEIPWASTIKDVNHLGVNMLLYWEVLQFAIKSGYREFDFGRSSIDSGTFRFKQQWGAKPRQSYWHYWLADGIELPALNPSNPKFALFIAVWKRLPVVLTKIIGPPVIKFLP